MIAVIGTLALWLLYGWLINTIVCSYLSGRKGYGERIGLATGFIFPPGVLVWLFIPAREDSDWKVLGPVGGRKVDALDAVDPQAGRETPGGPGPTAVG